MFARSFFPDTNLKRRLRKENLVKASILLMALCPIFTVKAACFGKNVTKDDLLELYMSKDHYRTSEQTIVLSNFYSDFGFIKLVAHKRECLMGLCNDWQRHYMPAPGDILRPELVLKNGNFSLKLEKKCQGSYGHGTTCQFNNGYVTCKYIPGRDQCGSGRQTILCSPFLVK